MNDLATVLKIRPGEGRMVALLIGLMLFTSAGGSIGGNGIEALFFARFGAQFLPYMYMALGVVTLAMALVITALLGRAARERLYTLLALILALVLVGAWALLTLKQSWVYPALWLGMNVTGSLQGLLTWGLAGVACDTRQAKRLFPLFSAGGILGAVIGGLGTQTLANALHAENLLLVWAGALLLAFLASRALVRRAPARRLARRRPTRLIDEMQRGYQFVRQSTLMRWMSIAAVLLAVPFFSLALPFARAAAEQFPAEDELAGFLGLFQGLSTGVAFLVSLFLANRLFARFGIMRMNLVYPIIYLAGFGVLTVYATFPVLVAFRFLQASYLFGIAGTAYQAAFNVVPPERRDQTRAFIEGVPGQAGTVIAGLILVIGGKTLPPQQLYVIGLGAAVLATLVMWQAARSYGGALMAALRAGQPHLFFSEDEPFGGFQRDAAAVAVSVAGLSDRDPVVRRVSADILGILPVPEAIPALQQALVDQDTHVRLASLRALARAGAAAAMLEVSICLTDPEPEVREQAIDTLNHLATGSRGLIAHLRPLLNDSAAPVRARAAVVLLRASRDAQAQEALTQLAESTDPEARVSALTALGEWGDVLALGWLRAGLSDPAPGVRRAAALALPRIESARPLEWLIPALGDADVSVGEAAATAIGRLGAPALEAAVAALADPRLESGALLALEHLPAREGASKLLDYARHKVAEAVHYHRIGRSIEAELSAIGGPDTGSHSGAVELLTWSLRDKAHSEAIHALRALGLVGDRAALALVIKNLKSRDPGQRANALETLESVGEGRIARPLLVLWEASESAPAAPDGMLQALQATDAWLRACAALAALAAGATSEQAIRSTLARLVESDPDESVRETVASALKRESAANTLAALTQMERILFLRRVPLFADLVPADLRHVGAIATERAYSAEQVIARMGDAGDEMYIIVSGEVRVLAGEGPELARRRVGEIVGEMAIISREPRMASLVAAGEVRLLSIDRQNFEALLQERPQTAWPVVRVLCQRLKDKPAL